MCGASPAGAPTAPRNHGRRRGRTRGCCTARPRVPFPRGHTGAALAAYSPSGTAHGHPQRSDTASPSLHQTHRLQEVGSRLKEIKSLTHNWCPVPFFGTVFGKPTRPPVQSSRNVSTRPSRGSPVRGCPLRPLGTIRPVAAARTTSAEFGLLLERVPVGELHLAQIRQGHDRKREGK